MKKILSVILALSMCLTIGVLLTACGHEHTWDTVWDTDETHHWHVCTGEECTEVNEKGEHEWDEGKITSKPTATANGKKTFICKVCGEAKYEPVYAKTEVTATEWETALKLNEENFSVITTSTATVDDVKQEMTFSVKRNGDILQQTRVLNDSDSAYNTYYAKEGNKYYRYTVQGSEAAAREEIEKAEYEEVVLNSGTNEIFKFADFTYNKTEKAYTAAEITVGEGDHVQKFTNVSIKFVDGKLATMTYSNVGDGVTTVCEAIAEYGNVPAIILPVIDAAA